MKLPSIGKLNLTLLGSALLLTGTGLCALWIYDQDGHAYFQRQLVFAGIGFAAMFAVMVPHYRLTKIVAYPGYLLVGGLLLALLFFARATNGARGWFAIGPIKVQPAELAKIAVVLAAARWITFAQDLQTVRRLLVPAALILAPSCLILLQPDLGNAMLFTPVAFGMLFVGGARPRHIAFAVTLLLVAAPIQYRFFMKDYQRNRLTSFLWPDQVPKELSYQQTQSVKACAAGGLGGAENGGYVVPERHTDFVFSIIAEEFGFIGSTFVLALFALLLFQAGLIAVRTREPYGRLVAVGLSSFLALQVFINVGMATGVAPITGLTLPFVSYGGSSLVTCFVALGLIHNVGARWVPTFSSRDIDPGHRSIHEFVLQEEKWLPDLEPSFDRRRPASI